MLKKEQLISKNVAKYGWRYEIFDKWVLDHGIPVHEKSVFSQLKARTQTFGEKLAKRLYEQYGIDGIFLSKQEAGDKNSLLPKEFRLIEIFRSLPNEEIRNIAIKQISALVNESSEMRDRTIPASKEKKQASGR